MVGRNTATALVASLMLFVEGCAHQQLRWNAVQQSRTLTDIYEQQVLDNLAMFVQDQGSLPFFAFPNGGGTDVTDEGGAGTDLKWNATTFVDGVLRFNGRRNMKQAWTLSPVTDPRRLELMRCAYQQVVSQVAAGDEMRTSCPDCERIYKRFYLGTPTSVQTVAEHTAASGKVTAACLSAGGWFAWGCSRCVPRNCEGLKVGRYRQTCVWVLPGGQEELSKLTLVMLDFATNQPQPTPPSTTKVTTKEVTWYFDGAGNSTTKDKAHREVRATVPYDQPTGFGTGVRGSAAEAQVFGRAVAGPETRELEVAPAPFAPPNGAPFLLFENYREFLTPEDR